MLDVIESSSESSDEDFVTMDDDLKHIVTSKAPLSSSSGKRCEQLMFKCNQKVSELRFCMPCVQSLHDF